MLCPLLNQQSFCVAANSPAAAAAVAAAATATTKQLSHQYIPTTSHTLSSSALYSIPLPPQPFMPSTLDSFSTSSTPPCSLPTIPLRSSSWHQINNSNSATNATATTSTATATTNTTPKQSLILDSLTASKVSMVENLVADTAALIIESIWPSPSGAQYSAKAPVIPLHIFVKETLRRSRTTLSTLQLALYYIYKVRNQVLAAQEKIRQDQIQHLQQRALLQQQPLSPNGSTDAFSEEEFKQRDYFNTISLHPHHVAKNTPPLTPPGTNNTPASLSPLSLSTSTPTSPILAKSEPVGCGRRMFLAALILASKFQQDRTYSNKAWSKISGLPVSEINLNEITFLTLIDYRLFVSQSVFQKWVTILTEKGRVRDRPVLSRSSSLLSSDSHQPTRRNSIQYCNNALPSRMTCVTASSLEDQLQKQQQIQQIQQIQQLQQQSMSIPPQTMTPSNLPSFALLVGDHNKQASAPLEHGSSFQFDFTAPGAHAKLSMDAINTMAKDVSGLIQPESAPRQQQGMGSYLTHRWVQAQRREFLRSRMQAMGYTFTESPRASPQAFSQPLPPGFEPQQQNQNCMIVNHFQNNIITYSQSRVLSRDKMLQRLETKPQDPLLSPAPSVSPNAHAGSKRRASDMEPLSEQVTADSLEMRSRTRRRLSVSFLVDC
ncbi:hypothetical protein BX616_005093 [Lobosporangium transversale]|nr:hypothetical protein BX616_005093 [Lobosporangium transversale]